MSNLPLDPDGVQPFYTITHIASHESLSKETPFCDFYRSNLDSKKLVFMYWETEKDMNKIVLDQTIAKFRLKAKQNTNE